MKKTEKILDTARTASNQISKDRQKSFGEIFTPPALVNEMLDQIPPEMWLPGKTILEPAAGDGNFLIEILKRKLAAGCSSIEAIQDCFAIEYMKDNVETMKKRVLDLLGDTKEIRDIVDDHIVHANTLSPEDTSNGRRYPDWLLKDHNSLSINNVF